MGKITTLLISGPNMWCLNDEELLTRLHKIKRTGGLKKLAVKIQEREFNTRKQADIYLMAVQDTMCNDVYVTDNPKTIKDIRDTLKEIYETFLQKGK